MNKFKDIAIGMVTGLLVVMFMFAMVTEAKTHTGLMGEDDMGRKYSTHLGYFTVAGKTYYAHHSRSAMYKKGELATSTYRVRNNKMYYFGADGAMLTRKTPREKSSRYIDFNRDGSVWLIYPAGYYEKLERYNAKRHRFQEFVDGEWKDTGMQCWPFGMIDFQW